MSKNILILTIDCWNLDIGANSSYTYSNLFSSMDEYKLSNIYIREELPNDPCCQRYFQIRETKVIKSLLNRKVKTGREVLCGEDETVADKKGIEGQKEFYHKQRAHFYYTKLLVREIIWLLSAWKSKELDKFLDEAKPDVILYSMEGYIHFNRLCRYVVKKTGAKAIGYFWDDNFTYKQRPKNFGYKVLRFFQRRSLKKLTKETDDFFAIAPKTKKEADEFFNISCRLLPKPAERDVSKEPENSGQIHNPIKIMYAGNLMIGRMETIKMLADELAVINKDEVKITLDVYTNTKVPDDLLNAGAGVTFNKPVSQSEILNLQQEADILLFAEDIAGKERKVARLSFSTKIPDYMSSGKCILALGDYDTAPMEYFMSEDIALCAQDKNQLSQRLNEILNNPEILKEYGKKAYIATRKYHLKSDIQSKVKAAINEVLA